MADVGRPTKYTPDTVAKITKALKLGSTRRLACQYAGISEDTLANWLRDYSDFSDAVNKAEGDGSVEWLNRIEQAAKRGSWQAAAWKLERLYPNEYGRQVIDHQSKGAQLTGLILDLGDDGNTDEA